MENPIHSMPESVDLWQLFALPWIGRYHLVWADRSVPALICSWHPRSATIAEIALA